MSGYTLAKIHGVWVHAQSSLDSVATASPMTVTEWRNVSMCVVGAFLFMVFASIVLVPGVIALNDWKWRVSEKIRGSGNMSRVSKAVFGNGK